MVTVDQKAAAEPVLAEVETGDTGRPAPVGSHTGGDTAIRIVAYILLVFVALLMFVPFAYAVATSFKSRPEALQIAFDNLFWPNNPTAEAYRVAWDSNVGRWFFNSVVVALAWIVGRVIARTPPYRLRSATSLRRRRASARSP